MRAVLPEDWPDTIEAARELQQRLRSAIVTEGEVPPPRLIAGVDVHYAERTGLTWGAVVLLDGATLEIEESALAAVPTGFPYVPGFLSFREIPAALAALALLSRAPDLIMVDGHGIAHPRRMGIAAHLGVIVDVPTIGVAKSRLFGRYEGAVLRTRDRINPLFVSVGHRIGLERAVELVLATGGRYRLPEPTRLADKLSRFHPY